MGTQTVRIYQALPSDYPKSIEPNDKGVLSCTVHHERMNYNAPINGWVCVHCNEALNIASVPRALALGACEIVA